LAVCNAELNKQMKETDREIKELRKSQKETTEQMNRTDKRY